MANEDRLMESLSMAHKLINNKEFMNHKSGSNGNYCIDNEVNYQTNMVASVPYSTPQQNEIKNSSKLPKEIFESMVSNPITVNGEGVDTTMSNILSQMEPHIKSTPKAPQNINENLRVNNTPIPTGNSNIDYSVIKALIDESIKRNLSELKTELINENTSIKTMRITNGNKIQVLDKQGNLYEGTLTFKKKLEKNK